MLAEKIAELELFLEKLKKEHSEFKSLANKIINPKQRRKKHLM